LTRVILSLICYLVDVDILQIFDLIAHYRHFFANEILSGACRVRDLLALRDCVRF
jgi:hypothetical protein